MLPVTRRRTLQSSAEIGAASITRKVGRVARPRRTQFTGCLLGGAIGDALGYPIEFMDAAAIRKRHPHGVPESLTLVGGVALVSDDTQMTLFSAEAILRAQRRWLDRGISSLQQTALQAYRRWLATQERAYPWGPEVVALNDDDAALLSGWLIGERALWSRRAPGNTCLSALRAASAGEVPPIAANNSKGCGGVMRAAPFGLGARSRQQAFTWGRDTAALTHGHPSGFLSAGVLAAVVHGLVHRVPLRQAIDHAMELLAKERGKDEVESAVLGALRAAESGPPSVEAIESLGGGWVGEEALAIALLCAATCESREPEAVARALWRAAAHGGDSDSTAAITGNLLGAMFGEAALPRAWARVVELRGVTLCLARDLWSATVTGAKLDEEAYPGW